MLRCSAGGLAVGVRERACGHSWSKLFDRFDPSSLEESAGDDQSCVCPCAPCAWPWATSSGEAARTSITFRVKVRS